MYSQLSLDSSFDVNYNYPTLHRMNVAEAASGQELQCSPFMVLEAWGLEFRLSVFGGLCRH